MQQSFDFITRKIQDLRKEINKTASMSGLLVFFSCSFLIFSSFGLLESIFYLPKLSRNLILTAVIFTLIFVFWRFFLVSFLKLFGLFNPQTEETIAKFIGKKHTEIADKLLNSLQLYHEAKQNQNFEGKIFVELALEKSAKSLENINLLADVDKKPVKNNSKFLGISVLVALMPVLIFGTSYFTSFERIFSPTKEFAPPAEFSFEVFPKNAKILKGDSLQVFAKGKGDLPKKISLFLEEDGFQEVRTVSLDSSSSYKITLEGIRKEFIYHFEGEKENKFGKLSLVKTPLYKVEVGERPYVKSFTVKIIPPGYSKTPAINLPPNTGEITALKGSKVKIDLSSNNFISKATLKFSKNKPLEMKISDNFASVDFFVLEDETYSFELKDTEKINSIDAINYKILALQDEFPVIKMLYPTEDKTLDESLEMPLAIEIMDDYGFSKLVLNYTLASKKNDEENLKFLTQKIEINPNITTFGQVQHLWKMLDLKMQPEDEVVFFLELYDNDTISGPKKTQTEKLRLRYPSIEEIFSSFEEEQKEVTESLEEMLEKSKEAEKFLEKTTREFKKDQNLDWQEKKKLEETLKNQQEMNEKMDDLKEQMKEMVEELEKNNLISEEILKKYQELQEVLKEIATPEMKKAMEELQKALEQADQKQIEKAMQNFEMSQKEYLENLERSLELFKNIQLEQKMDELVKRTEELAQKQNELNEQTAKSDSTSKQAGEELAKQQEELKKEEKSAEELAKEVEK
ncbi:hypothetical protein IT568_10770, partial [bacterium]|nr:hypothetical protein [bacterium]